MRWQGTDMILKSCRDMKYKHLPRAKDSTVLIPICVASLKFPSVNKIELEAGL